MNNLNSDLKQRAVGLLQRFVGPQYAFGLDVISKVTEFAAEFGSQTLMIANSSGWLQPTLDDIRAGLAKRGIGILGGEIYPGAAPNTPREDVYRIRGLLLKHQPQSVIVVGGGSTIDAVKAANVLAVLHDEDPDLDSYFGTGLVTKALRRTGKQLYPMIAVQTAASSGAHLTKYSNVTDTTVGQKKLIVDDAIVPARAVFDYRVTSSAPMQLTLDGAFDGLSHCLEVLFGAPQGDGPAGADPTLAEITLTGIELLIHELMHVPEDSTDENWREGLGLGTDLGGCAIMVGGTNGAHLTSFSLIDLTTHGRACALMNPYYTVFFAPAIEPRLRAVGEIFRRAGLLDEDAHRLSGRALGEAVAGAMLALSRKVGFPTKLSDLDGWNDSYIAKALEAAKDPQLEMKLKNMPVPLTADLVDEYMGSVLKAAEVGDFSLVKNLDQ